LDAAAGAQGDLSVANSGAGGFGKEQGMSSELPSRNMLSGNLTAAPEQRLDAQRVLWGVWRRRKLCLAVGLVAFAIGSAVVAGTPDVYRAEAAVRVEQSRVSPELVNATVTQQIEDRLKTIQSELFARPLLERVVQEQNLYPDVVKKRGLAGGASELRSHLDVKVEGENAFELTFEDGDPKVAAAVANRLPELFAQEALKVRAEQAEQAQELFSDELAKLSREVALQEQKIGEFKLSHLGELPEQLESNMRGLERLTVLLGQKTEAMREAQRRVVDASKGRIDADSDAARLARHESELGAALDNARSAYTEDHPEVQRLNRELGTVHVQRASAEAAARAADTSRAEAASELRGVESEVSAIQQQADTYRTRIENTPRWTMPLAELDRRYDILKTKYQQMLSRKVEAEVAADQELRARSQTFHVLAAAVLPPAPARPDRHAGMMMVTLAALALALLAGVVLELQDDSLREPADAHHALQLPVLAVVPDLGRKTLFGTGKTLRPAVNRSTFDA
jgi:polysaccharide chain length determinant protein (PEP-CTERM system associated)